MPEQAGSFPVETRGKIGSLEPGGTAEQDLGSAIPLSWTFAEEEVCKMEFLEVDLLSFLGGGVTRRPLGSKKLLMEAVDP